MDKHLVFDDLYDFWGFAFKESNAITKSSRNNSSDWNGGISWVQTKMLARSGWHEGLNEMAKFQAIVNPLVANKIVSRTPVYAQVGHTIDIGAYLSNNPEYFMATQYDERIQRGKIIKIVCSISFSSAIASKTIIQRGAMICALVDAIENAGYRAEIICNLATSKDKTDRNGDNKEKGWFEVDVTLKKANQHLNRTQLAFCLAHPAMLRRVMFSVAEIEGWSDYTSGSFGCPAKATDKGDLYIEEICTAEISNQEAIDWVLSEWNKLEIQLVTLK